MRASAASRIGLALALGLAAGPALAGASSAPFGYVADPALRNATPGELEGRIKRSCISTQMSLQKTTDARVHRPCGCYAARIMADFTPAEIDVYRRAGVFSDASRPKALAALDECRLQRPI